MTGKPHRSQITGVVNKAKPGGARSPLPASPNPAPAADFEPGTRNEEPSALSSYTYVNDLLGRRETISQGGDAFGMLKLGQNQVEVAYNDRSEVTGAVYRTGGEARQTFDYTYDGIGNRRTAVSSRVTGQESREEKVSYEANALNQYAAIDERGSSNPKSENGGVRPSQNPQFDPDGNRLEDARNRYTWNADNNLIRVDAKDGSLRLDYIYDHQSRRTVRIETTNPGKDNESRRTTYYLYDDWNLVADVSAVTGHRSGVTGEEAGAVRYYTWGRDLSGSLQGAGGVGGLLAISKVNPGADERGGAQPEPSVRDRRSQTLNLKLETLFPTYDANGNVGQLIDNAGTIVAAYSYDPFGNVNEMAGAEAAENPWRFSTKPVEEGTGWLYYGYRWYDAGTGRWVNRDPIEESGGVNLYGFVGNDGVGMVDLLGLETICTPYNYRFQPGGDWDLVNAIADTIKGSSWMGSVVGALLARWEAQVTVDCKCACYRNHNGTSEITDLSDHTDIDAKRAHQELFIKFDHMDTQFVRNADALGEIGSLLKPKAKLPKNGENRVVGEFDVEMFKAATKRHAENPPERPADGKWVGDNPCKQFE